MTIETHPYRADIDGLRALAIVPVVLFHVGIPGFSGGFVGVDVFFVISGYLITSIIYRQIRAGSFSLVGFYERRIRRIIPALFAVMACCAIASPFFLYPEEYRHFARSLITATLFVSSVQFRQESGYFDIDAHSKPLLHTWSLSVEELFYVFFPITLLLIARCCRSRRSLILWAIFFMSFLAAVGALYLDKDSKAAFYLAHFRAWEFLIGALLALSGTEISRSRPVLDALSIAGVLLIAVAVFGYSETTTFPGFAALIPCLGAALVILAGQHRPSLAGRILSRRPFVMTGLTSYSLYLWHWPLFVFVSLWLGRRPTIWEAALLVVASFGLALFSWRYIERPFRGKSGFFSRGTLFGLSAGAATLMISVGLHGELTEGWLSRYPEAVATILAAGEDRDARQKECLSTARDARGCLYGKQGTNPTIALWGDSIAAAYAVMLGDLVEDREESLLALTMPACPPAPGWQIEYQDWRESCERFQTFAMRKLLETEAIHTVYLAANFAAYVEISENQEGFRDDFYRTIDSLLIAGKKVVIVYPFSPIDPPTFRNLIRAAAADNEAVISQFTESFLQNHKASFAMLDGLGKRPDLLRVYPHEGLCDDTRCYIYKDGQAFYYDEDHISLTGAALLSPLFERVLRHPPNAVR